MAEKLARRSTATCSHSAKVRQNETRSLPRLAFGMGGWNRQSHRADHVRVGILGLHSVFEPVSAVRCIVLTALKDQLVHVPFRDSLLTRMLRVSLKGSCVVRVLAWHAGRHLNIDPSIHGHRSPRVSFAHFLTALRAA